MLPIVVLPSLLACDFSRVGDEIARCEKGGADGVHLDVMDGHFVPNLTMGPDIVKAVRKATKTALDAHLMVTDPIAASRWFADAGVDSITFHAEVASDGRLVADAVRDLGKKVGVSLNPDTPFSAIRPVLRYVDQVLVMSVFPGFGGQKFMTGVLDKIHEIRQAGFSGDVQVDGGINDETAAQCAEAGANVFIAGTFLFHAADMSATIKSLRARAQAAFTRGILSPSSTAPR